MNVSIMRVVLVACFLLCASAAHINELIKIENPPTTEENNGEFCLIPYIDGRLHRVNTTHAMSEPIPDYNPKFSVKFELYTKDNLEPQIFDSFDEAFLRKSNFNHSRPTRFVTHGWGASGELNVWFREAFLTKGHHDVNLFVVNWGTGSDTFNYIAARRRVEPVGQYLADFIEFLIKVSKLNLKTTHLIGHSLGAHVSGFAGKNIRSGKCAQITALDAAAPLFHYKDPTSRVARGDADYVESIHTNGGLLGFNQPIGDASFYPNGGRSQPGCGWDFTGSCAHSRAYKLLAESIASQKSVNSYECDSFERVTRGNCLVRSENVNMGGEPGNEGSVNGVFYFRTASKSPFISQTE